MAVEAVDGELVSAMNSLVSGILQGNARTYSVAQPRMAPKNLRVREMTLFLAGNINGTDQGKVLSLQR